MKEFRYPLVSAVIPTRNRTRLVVRAVQSALAQTYAALEVIVVIDGPDAGSVAAINAIGDARVRVIPLPDHVGGSEARNVGIRAATGKYIALLDDDDIWLPEKIAKQVAAAEKCESDECLVVTRYKRVFADNGNEVWPIRLPALHEHLSEFMVSSRCGFQTPVLFAHRDLMQRVPFTHGLKKHQDWDWMLRVACRPGFRLLIVDEVLAQITVWPATNQNSISRRSDWRFSVDWATQKMQEGLMTSKGYGLFLTKVCIPAARKQSAPVSALLQILLRILLLGKPSFVTAMDAFQSLLCPVAIRLWLRETKMAVVARKAYLEIQGSRA